MTYIVVFIISFGRQLKNNELTHTGKIYVDTEHKGWDVIVFVPSKEEDSDRITCGNALISEEKI